MVGGYKIIDLKGINITSSAVVVPGIHDALESALNKPILLRNFFLYGIEQQPFFAIVVPISDGSYMINYRTTFNAVRYLLITADDEISIKTDSITVTPASSASETDPSVSM